MQYNTENEINRRNSVSNNYINLKEFIKISPKDMEINVTKFNSNFLTKTTYEVILSINSVSQNIYLDCSVQKRYTEFQGFYDSITYRYQNLKFPTFPSKFQILKKEESRKKFFDSILKTVLKLASAHIEIEKELLKLLYEFIIEKNQGIEIKPFTKQKSNSISDKEITNLNTIESGNIINETQSHNASPCTRADDVMNPSSVGSSDLKNRLTHVSLINTECNPNNNKIENTAEDITLNTTRDGWQIEYKFTKNNFSKAYAKIKEECLFLYDSILTNNFFLCYPLFKINYDIYKINDDKRSLIEQIEISEAQELILNNNFKDFSLANLKSEIHIHLYHAYDSVEFILKFDTNSNDFCEILKFLNLIENISLNVKLSSKFLLPIDETNLYIYGKLFFEIGQIVIPDFEGNIFANIILQPYILKTKSTISTSTFSIRQMFAIPIHNRFEILKIEIFNKTHQGLFHKKVVEEKLCEHFIRIPDLLNNYFFPNNMVQVEMENSSKNVKINSKISVAFKLKNYSSILALITKNKNKNVLEDMTVAKSEEDISMKNLLKRMKKIIILMKGFKEYYKTVFRFKYPIYSSLMCLFLTLYFVFFDIHYSILHILVFIFYVIFVNSSIFKTNLYPYCEKYIFGLKNPYDFESIVQTKIEMEDDEVKKEDYLREQKEKKNLIKTFIEPIKNFKNIKNTYLQVLFKFTTFVSNLEKIKNLFLWTDPLLTFYFLIMIFCLVILIYAIPVKFILLFSVVNKFFSGITFYKRKYANNLEIANIVLEHCHREWCNETKNKLKSVMNGDKKEINVSTSNPPIIINEDIKNIDNVIIFDDKFKLLIKEQLEKHADILIKIEFLSSVIKLGEIKDVISKCKTLLKIKKESQLYSLTRNNKNIYKTPLDIELILLYFVQNIKSDYYLSKYYHQVNEGNKNLANNYSSISNADTVKTEKK